MIGKFTDKVTRLTKAPRRIELVTRLGNTMHITNSQARGKRLDDDIVRQPHAAIPYKQLTRMQYRNTTLHIDTILMRGLVDSLRGMVRIIVS